MVDKIEYSLLVVGNYNAFNTISKLLTLFVIKTGVGVFGLLGSDNIVYNLYKKIFSS